MLSIYIRDRRQEVKGMEDSVERGSCLSSIILTVRFKGSFVFDQDYDII